jgi:formylglycine-generating enzyme required for sulfatase activity
MVHVADFCIDRYEAPNVHGASPLVMYSFAEAQAWCSSHGRRLCYDDEWTRACAGPDGLSWPYGDTHQPGACNDEQVWRLYNQTLLSQWPSMVCGPDVVSLGELFASARAVSAEAADSADHVEWLYQGEVSGANTTCRSGDGVYDLCGNVEEWTRRRDGGTTDFHGSLKGRYWAEAASCQSDVISHGDAFRFYELGFRCCAGGVEPVFSDGFESGDTSAWSSEAG